MEVTSATREGATYRYTATCDLGCTHVFEWTHEETDGDAEDLIAMHRREIAASLAAHATRAAAEPEHLEDAEGALD